MIYPRNSKEPQPVGRTVYDASLYKHRASTGKIILLAAAVLLLLAAVRFLNLTLWWNMTRLEISQSNSRVGDYTFLGLSSRQAAQDKLMNSPVRSMKAVSVAAYFDGFHPMVFLVNCNRGGTFTNLGLTAFYPQTGVTTVIFHPTEIIETHRNGEPAAAVYFGRSLFPVLYEKLAGFIAGNGVGESAGNQKISFILNRTEDTDYLNIPYYIYFYVPLLGILFLGAYYGRVFYISFFYFPGLFLLFDFRRVLFTGPFDWLIRLTGLEISQTAAAIVSAVLVGLFVLGGFAGIFNGRNRDSDSEPAFTTRARALIFFFLLLPLALRF